MVASSACSETHTVARVGMADLMMWSLGVIDDAELARRVSYRVPGAPSQDPATPSAIP